MSFKDISLTKCKELFDSAQIAGVTLVVGKGVIAEGFDSILQISDTKIRLKYKSGKIEICGEGLNVGYLGSGELDVSGRIDSIRYE